MQEPVGAHHSKYFKNELTHPRMRVHHLLRGQLSPRLICMPHLSMSPLHTGARNGAHRQELSEVVVLVLLVVLRLPPRCDSGAVEDYHIEVAVQQQDAVRPDASHIQQHWSRGALRDRVRTCRQSLSSAPERPRIAASSE